MNNVRNLLIPAILMAGISLQAVELKREGWNLVGVCQDINRTQLAGLSGIEEIQDQSGNVIYIGQYADYSTFDSLEAGYGYWVKGNIGSLFDSKIAQASINKPLKRDGWNLQAICSDYNRSFYQNASGIEEMQDQSGNVVYIGMYYDYSTLNSFESGYGYWVKGAKDTLFKAYDGVALPSTHTVPAINNAGTVVSTTYGNYTVKIFGANTVVANAQANHDVVFFTINGQSSASLSIQVGYTGIVIAVYNGSNLVYVSSPKTSFNGPDYLTSIVIESATSIETPPEVPNINTTTIITPPSVPTL